MHSKTSFDIMTRMRTIGIMIERQRAYGRRLCEGIVRFAQERNDWSLRIIEFAELDNRLRQDRYDGFIVRVMNDEITKKLAKTGKPVVLVLVNGRPLTVNWEDENLPSILEMWFPNCEGGNILAETLFGENNPSGKITVTFPKSIGQIEYNFPYKKGSHGGQRRSGDPNGTGISRVIGPLYPFGHGLSYTTFAYSDLSVSASYGKGMTVTATVTNTGKRAGGEVVQLYVRDKVSSVVTYDSVLRGFEKVFLEPGESEKVSFTLTLDDLSLVGKDLERVFEPGEFDIMIGSSSNDIRLSMTVGLQ